MYVAMKIKKIGAARRKIARGAEANYSKLIFLGLE